ncbi:MAG TPA: UbiA family prenyltransferase [Candidatus Moranbacteria bacterium]|nr:UbiA family prenyltransferase [Candidatus Moranbacteria bacterium]HRZ33571.1 UbiA family prenyltransferase [Candidatus Moranbacteria bacterium]
MSNSNNEASENDSDFSLLKVIFTVFCIIGIRMPLDKLAYQSTGNYFLPYERAVHASLYYFSVFLALSILVYLLTKISFKDVLNFLTKVFLFILLVPLTDLVFTIGKTSPPIYLVTETNEILVTFFKIMNPFSGQGITLGQHIGAYAIFISLAIFIYKKTRSVSKSLFSIIAGYAILFVDAVIPSIISFFGNKNFIHDQSAISSYAFILKDSWITNSFENISNNLDSFLITPTTLNFWNEIAIARFFWIYIFIEIIIILFITNKRLWSSFKKNLRIERIAYWFIIATIGIIINQKMFGSINLQNPVNFISLLLFFSLIALNIWLAVFINDAEDIEIDKISNPERPLVKKEFSEQEWHTAQVVLCIFIAFGLATLNNATAFLLLLAQAPYYIYSAKPLRLKKHFLFSSILIGFATISVAMSGFFLVSPNQSFFVFPIKAIVILGISYALVSNLKDIKDFEGDSYENIKTIPVVFGLKNAKYIIATLCAIVIITIPIILKMYSMLFFSILIASFLFYLFIKKIYQEKYIFLSIFLYLLLLFVSSL